MIFIALLGLFVPGYVLARACRIPTPQVAAFPLSALLLTQVVIWYAIAGVPIRFATVLSALATATAAAGLWHFLRKTDDSKLVTPVSPDTAVDAPPILSRGSVGLALAVVAGIALRSSLYPLSGFDTVFRWDALARAMLTHETLDYYPPLTADDFRIYAFPDGIPPLASTVYWWLYAGWGGPVPAITAIPVVLQLGCVMLLAFMAAREFAGDVGAYLTLLCASSSTLLTGGIAIGQETGYTALSVAGQIYFALAAVRRSSTGCVVVAACFAALGALARDYGIALSVAGLAILASHRPMRRQLPLYMAVVACLSLPWYCRNFYLTGNPLYSNDVLGWLPVNPVHTGILQTYARLYEVRSPWGLATIWTLFTGAPLALSLGAIAALVVWRKTAPMSLCIAVTAILWVWSVRFTSGGLDYSMRVLTPMWVALSISASTMGPVLLREAKLKFLRIAIAVASSVAGIFAAGHAFSFPYSVTELRAAVFNVRPDPLSGCRVQLALADALEKGAWPPCGILTDDAYLAAALRAKPQFRAVMIWSPEVDFVFSDLAPIEIRRRLRKMNIFLVSVSSNSPNLAFQGQFPFFREDSENWTEALVSKQGGHDEILAYLPPVEKDSDDPPNPTSSGGRSGNN